jgi:hypothetical protein
LSATCRALRPYLIICPTASPPGYIKAETRSGGAYVAHRNRLERNITASTGGPLPAPPGAAPWRRWRTLRPRPLASSLPWPRCHKYNVHKKQLVHFALKSWAAEQACRRRSAVE